MKRAIVLSGGGAQGAYQVGVWKALRKLKITYDIVTGTSVGALNGMLMVQKDYHRATWIWRHLGYDDVLDNDISATMEEKKSIINKFIDISLRGGTKTNRLESIVEKALRTKKFYNSSIDFGLVTTKFPSLKPLYLSKSNLKESMLRDYLVASSALFPFFKRKIVDNKTLIDGGFYDNLPINFAIELGATEIIAVNLKTVGRTRKVLNLNIPVTLIQPRNNLGSIIAFEHDFIEKAMDYGYNDAMKTYGELEGDCFTFRKKHLNYNYQRFHEYFDSYLLDLIKKKSYPALAKVINSPKEFNKILEYVATILELPDDKIYDITYFNFMIKKNSNLLLKDKLETNRKLKRLVTEQKQTVLLYKIITGELKNNKELVNSFNAFPEQLLAAVYIKTIINHSVFGL